MNRTRLFVGLLAAIFLSAVGVGVVLGQEDRPMRQVASTTAIESTTTTVARTTTTRAPSTTTTTAAPAPTTTAAPPTTARPATTVATIVTIPPTTQLPVTEPPTSLVTTTTIPPYDPIKCADINNTYDVQGMHDDPSRVPLLQAFNCPPRYWV